jgi:hypothetical protein
MLFCRDGGRLGVEGLRTAPPFRVDAMVKLLETKPVGFRAYLTRMYTEEQERRRRRIQLNFGVFAECSNAQGEKCGVGYCHTR